MVEVARRRYLPRLTSRAWAGRVAGVQEYGRGRAPSAARGRGDGEGSSAARRAGSRTVRRAMV
jgi:hypothetical protein